MPDQVRHDRFGIFCCRSNKTGSIQDRKTGRGTGDRCCNLEKFFYFEDLLVQPWVGTRWEGWVIEQILAALNNRDASVEAFFFRTSDGHEVDLVLQLGRETWAVEIKLSSSVSRNDMQRLQKAAEMIGATRGILLSRAPQEIEAKNICAATIEGVLKRLLPESISSKR
jgi:hypothetical protein